MRRSALSMIFLLSLSILILLIPGSTAGLEGTKDVSIEKYLEFRIEFDHGDKLHLEADIQSTSHPLAIFLIKGEDAYNDWVASEDIDIAAIKAGEDISNMTISFKVIENFSKDNTTSFQAEIDIGEKDTYYLIIALHRDSSMTTDEAMTRAAQVVYDINWDMEEKDVPWYLLWVAGVLFIIGVILIGMYIYSTIKAREQMEERGRDDPPKRTLSSGITKGPGNRRRAPPMK